MRLALYHRTGSLTGTVKGGTLLEERSRLREITDLPGPRPLPRIGNPTKPAKFHLALERWAREYGPIYKLALGPKPVIAISNPATMQQILRDRPEGYRRWDGLEELFAELGAHGVFSAEGDDWRRQRKLADAALNHEHLKQYFEIIATETERLHRRLGAAAASNELLDIQRVLMSFTVDVVTALAFGHDVNTIENPDNELPVHIARMFATIARRAVLPFPYWRRFKLPIDRATDRSVAVLHPALKQFALDAREQLRQRPELREHPENFLQSMIAMQEADGSFTDDEIRGNTLSVMMAGEDTTAHTMSWATWFLACNPDVQERLAREAADALGDAPSPAGYDVAKSFDYGEAVVREVLRLKPAVPILGLQPYKDVELEDVRVPGGTRMMLLIRMASTREDYFTQAQQFVPDRWMPGGRPDWTHDVDAFVQFGGGDRYCAGHRLGLLEAKTVLAMLGRNFEFTVDDPTAPIEEQLHFTMGPHGLRVRVKARS
jgi:cytochrome P450